MVRSLSSLLSSCITRHEFPEILTAVGLTGFGVEVGTAEGLHAEWILSHWKGEKLYLVDPWLEQPIEKYRDGCNLSQDVQDKVMEDCRRRLAAFDPAAYSIIRGLSLDVVSTFEDAYFDFVYLDGNHNLWSIEADIAAWIKKVKPGGLFAGHDYVPDCPTFGVQTAVNRFCEQTGRELFIIPEKFEIYAPSWAVVA